MSKPLDRDRELVTELLPYGRLILLGAGVRQHDGESKMPPLKSVVILAKASIQSIQAPPLGRTF